uniref:A2-specific pheromone n=1 Tax=Mycosarcoma maydis TaxID=5270 RepID=MFA2_MYCMD|nr:RecName: Full=A2-specific pheromone; AltName: Full=Mating factor A2; Flags: Precursor [Ustilago maydis]AAA99771.1 mfa2 [Ustilago maydis]
MLSIFETVAAAAPVTVAETQQASNNENRGQPGYYCLIA